MYESCLALLLLVFSSPAVDAGGGALPLLMHASTTRSVATRKNRSVDCNSPEQTALPGDDIRTVITVSTSLSNKKSPYEHAMCAVVF